jgi:hypothetical protein
MDADARNLEQTRAPLVHLHVYLRAVSDGGRTMKKTIAIFAALALCAVCSSVYAIYGVNDTGTWPKSWPAELEGLRGQARTLVGPMVPARHYAIRFKNREEFEAAWPHILKTKSKGAPVFLVRGDNFFLDGKAGVVVHCPPEGQWKNPRTPEAPIEGVQNARMRWSNTNWIELVVDGDVVDLNRISLGEDGVVDERFKEEKK